MCYARTPWAEQLDERFRWQVVDSPDPVWHLRVAAAARRECDVFLSCNSYLTAPLLSIPCVVVVHDLLAFDHAMHVPLTSQIIERVSLPAAVRSAVGFVCVSQATASALEARFRAPVAEPRWRTLLRRLRSACRQPTSLE